MNYITIAAPPYPFFLYAGDALYRAGDLHSHRSNLGCFDMLFVEYGCLYMMEDGFPYEIKQDEALVLHPDHAHRAYKRCTEETYFHWMHFHTIGPFELSATVKTTPARNVRRPGFDQSDISSERYSLPVYQRLSRDDADCIYKMLHTLEAYSINRYQKGTMSNKASLLAENRLQQQKLFLDVLSKVIVHNRYATGSQIAHTAMQFLTTYYPRKITLAEMAEAANCHPTHVIRCFHEEYNTTPIKALTGIRLEEAKKLLATTGMTCEAIAETVGFSSSGYFSKVFKEMVGETPLRYRMMSRQ